MSYDTQELSVQDGAPVELYTFTQGSVTWHYTSRESNYTDATVSPSVVYTTIAIDRSQIEASNEQARNALKLTVPRTFPVAELFRVAPPTEEISITLRRVHRGDTTDVIVAWVGRVLTCEFSGASATLECQPISVSLARLGLRRAFQTACPYALYGEGCGLSKTSFDYATTVTAILGRTLTVAALDAAFNYAGGFIEWVNDDGITDRRFIESQENETLTLLQPFTGIAVSDSVTVYPGCDHTIATCNTVFSNAVNFGGMPYFPERNPFEHPVF